MGPAGVTVHRWRQWTGLGLVSVGRQSAQERSVGVVAFPDQLVILVLSLTETIFSAKYELVR